MTKSTTMQVFGLTFKVTSRWPVHGGNWQSVWEFSGESVLSLISIEGPQGLHWHHDDSTTMRVSTPEEALIAACLAASYSPPGFPYGEPALGGLALRVGRLYYFPEVVTNLFVLERQSEFQVFYTDLALPSGIHGTLEEALGALLATDQSDTKLRVEDQKDSLVNLLEDLRGLTGHQRQLEALEDRLTSHLRDPKGAPDHER